MGGAANPIRIENEREGTRSWLPDNVVVDPGTRRCTGIEGWCSELSAKSGDRVQLYVSADPPDRFTLNLYRMGCYGGAGAREVLSAGPLAAPTQATPERSSRGTRECEWEPVLEIVVEPDWLSGVYLGKLTAEGSGLQSYVIFVVRDDRSADLIVQCSDFTWHGYNTWPAQASLYDLDGRPRFGVTVDGRPRFGYSGPRTAVSFDRPFAASHFGGRLHGSAEYFPLEFPFHYWLEREGYDVTYCGNLDTHRGDAAIERAKGFLSIGHDEYYTIEIYERLRKAVRDGISVGFFSGNTCSLQIELRPSANGRADRVYGRVDVFAPPERDFFSLFPDLAEYPYKAPNANLLMGARTAMPAVGCADWVCVKPEHWVFAGTGMAEGDRIEGLVGWEWHADPADLPGLEVVAGGPTREPDVGEGAYTATAYPGPNGNVVFNAATIWWASGLSAPPGFERLHWKGIPGAVPDERAQRITANVLNRMIG